MSWFSPCLQPSSATEIELGDVTLLLAAVFTFLKFGVFAGLLRVPTGQALTDPFAFTTLSQGATAVLHGVVAGAGPRTVVILGILVFFAAMVRAGQVPFHVWLTEASGIVTMTCDSWP